MPRPPGSPSKKPEEPEVVDASERADNNAEDVATRLVEGLEALQDRVEGLQGQVDYCREVAEAATEAATVTTDRLSEEQKDLRESCTDRMDDITDGLTVLSERVNERFVDVSHRLDALSGRVSPLEDRRSVADDVVSMGSLREEARKLRQGCSVSLALRDSRGCRVVSRGAVRAVVEDVSPSGWSFTYHLASEDRWWRVSVSKTVRLEELAFLDVWVSP